MTYYSYLSLYRVSETTKHHYRASTTVYYLLFVGITMEYRLLQGNLSGEDVPLLYIKYSSFASLLINRSL